MSRPGVLGSETETIRGVLDRITFHNSESGYTVARMIADKRSDLITVVGSFASPLAGESVALTGEWTRHPDWGLQFTVQKYEVVRPTTEAAIEKYLGSGLIKGVGPVTAKRIVQRFGAETFEIIEKKPRKLLDVHGVSQSLVDRIKETWAQQGEIRSIMVFLQSHDVSPLMADKIYKTYKDQSIQLVEQNPYRLAYDIWGVGFSTADKIAQSLGISKDDPRRIQAALIYCMNQAVDKTGSVYLTHNQLADTARELVGDGDIFGNVQELIDNAKLTLVTIPSDGPSFSEQALGLPDRIGYEVGLAQRIKELLAEPAPTIITQSNLKKVIGRLNIELSDEQSAAVATALESRVTVLTGGPGTGKTTTTRAIVAALHSMGKSVQLASPTGRAAKRLSEVTGEEAATIHRILSYDVSTRTFQYGQGAPLPKDVLLIDEASMLDLTLACAVFRAVDNKAQVILVGDVDQLPSVGAGNVLRDLIDSGVVPVARLTTIFRQAAQSRIVTGAHAVNHGQMPDITSPRDLESDCVFVEALEGDDVADKIVGVVSVSLPKRGFAPSDIQVLSPMQKGTAGAINLNQRLQQALNPPTENCVEATRAGRVYRTGDRVIQIRNNYDKSVFNGDVGIILSIDSEEENLVVKYPDQDVNYDFSDLDELSLAYALSVHKSQGSEFPAVVIALHTQHYALLQRQIVYTALTRARKMAVIVGSGKAIAMAVRNDRQGRRLTLLKERVQGLL